MAIKQVYSTEDVIDFLSGVKDFPLSDNDSEAFFQDEQTEDASIETDESEGDEAQPTGKRPRLDSSTENESDDLDSDESSSESSTDESVTSEDDNGESSSFSSQDNVTPSRGRSCVLSRGPSRVRGRSRGVS